jgi:hypothetical protein
MKATVFSHHQQQGAATLLTALVLLISITLVVLLTSKTVLVETQISADNYRTQQATAAAAAAMDQAVAYYKAGGFDQRNNTTGATGADTLVDYTGPGTEPTTASCAMPAATATTAFPLTLTSGAQTTFAHFFFNNTAVGNPCDTAANGIDTTRGVITAKGWSDDCTAVRTITQCVATFNIFSGDGKGPQQPFVGKGGVGAFGNAKIINRYTNSSIWSGGPDVVHGASFGTYLRPSNTEVADYTQEQLDSSCEASPCNVAGNPGPNNQLVSNEKSGTGLDVITNDPTLGTKTTSTTNLTDPAQNQFFDMFFGKTKSVVKNQADVTGQLFTAGTSLNGKKGLMWVEGNTNINGTDVIGTPTEPAILIINGNLDKLNGATIYGVVYVTGTIEIAGNPVVKGSIVAENPTPSTGAGTLTLVYKPWGSGGSGATNSPPFIAGTGAIIAGSWKDW